MANTLQSTTTKQLLGAVAGMLVAGVVYFGLQYDAGNQIKGLLVDSTNSIISNPAGQVLVSDPSKIDEGTQRKLERQAQGVSSQLQQFTVAKQGTPADIAKLRADQRLARRQQLNELAAARAMATEYATTDAVVTEQQRIAQRNAYAKEQRDGTVRRSPVAVQQNTVTTSSTVVHAAADEPVVTQDVHPGADVASVLPEPTRLSNSGVGTWLLTLASMAVAVAFLFKDPERRARFLGALQR